MKLSKNKNKRRLNVKND